MINKRFLVAVLFCALLLNLSLGFEKALAQATCDPTSTDVCNPLEYEKIEDLVDAIINFLFLIAVAVAPLIIIIGAFNILTSGGEPKKVSDGRTMIQYAAIGLGIILFSKGIIAVVKNILGAK